MDDYSAKELKIKKKKKKIRSHTSDDKLDFNIVYSRV